MEPSEQVRSIDDLVHALVQGLGLPQEPFALLVSDFTADSASEFKAVSDLVRFLCLSRPNNLARLLECDVTKSQNAIDWARTVEKKKKEEEEWIKMMNEEKE